jgi:hypothetical protein
VTTITRRLIEEDYDVTDADIRELCELKAASGGVDETLTDGYFKVLFKRTIKGVTGPSVEQRLHALEKADSVMYPIVLDVVGNMSDCKAGPNDDAATKQAKSLLRNQRSCYARTAKTTIRKAIEAGVDIENRRPDMVSKHNLDKETKQATYIKRTSKEIAASLANRLVTAMAVLKGDDPTAHAAMVSWIKSYNW